MDLVGVVATQRSPEDAEDPNNGVSAPDATAGLSIPRAD